MNRLGTIGLASAILVAALGSTAHADRGYYGLGGGMQRPGVEFFAPADRGYDRGYERDHRRGRDDRGGWRHRDERGACSPRDALRKAENMGVRRAEIVDVGRRTIEITGRSRGERVWLTFARAPQCPLVG